MLKDWIIPLVSAILAACVLYFYWIFTYFKRINIPYMTPIPFLGNMYPAFFRIKHIAEIIKEVYEFDLTSKYIGFFAFHSPGFFIRDPEVIKLIGVKYFDNFPEHQTYFSETQDPFFGKNLFFLRGQKWKKVRNVLTPAFTGNKMRMMFCLINKCAVDFAEYITKDALYMYADVDIKDAFTRYTNDVIASCAFGISVNSMQQQDNEFYTTGRKATNMTFSNIIKLFIAGLFPRLCYLLNLRFLDKKTTDYFKGVIQQTVETRDKQEIIRGDMLQLLMDARGKTSDIVDMNIEEMTAQAFIFFFAGFETTASLMCFVSTMLALHPEIQETLQKEVDSVIEETNGNVTYEKISGMAYLDAIVNETLRLYPINPMIDRVCVKDSELPPNRPEEKPTIVKSGQIIWFPIYAMHRDSQYYPNPEKFDPERFLNVKPTLNQATYMPFGIGPRSCLGNRFAILETKVVIFHLLSKCSFRVSKKLNLPITLDYKTFVFAIKGGFWLKLEPRNKSV